jgi:hypothetical protein
MTVFKPAALSCEHAVDDAMHHSMGNAFCQVSSAAMCYAGDMSNSVL